MIILSSHLWRLGSKVLLRKAILICLLALIGLYPVKAWSTTSGLCKTVYYTQEAALKKVFPTADKIVSRKVTLSESLKKDIETKLGWRVKEKNITYFIGYKNKLPLGYAVVLDEMGKHYPMTFMTRISPKLKVDDVVLMVYREEVGSQVHKNRFVRQFFGKTLRDPIAIDQDIIGITGATVSSWSMAGGIRKALVFTETLKPYI